ncbi:hypothetical protein NCC78_11715 [Micromonospora phytophila]|uniref:hypothetical protein n=1 Tax=Micromonospora phytophila TaxID=709888 RepID=UPI00202FE55B|nr:hypothetical protein [Micromonospora phytophila]MCM0675349.1 hypothetical protein [Micromonospora phytophila]
MAAVNPAKGTARAGRSNAWKGFAIGSAAVVLGGVCLAGALADNDDSTVVPPPTATERSDTVPLLRKARDSQGVCYGWRLEDGQGATVSVGSNLGDGVTVTDNPQCPRWLQVVGNVSYTPESSESEDSAYVSVDGSGEFEGTDLLTMDQGLARLGITDEALLDDPGWAVTRAAVSLPLLVAERGLASAAPVVTAAPATPPAPLPDAGSDLWRDRWGHLVAAAGLLLLTALLVTVGVVQRRRQRRAEAPQAAAGRTPEEP